MKNIFQVISKLAVCSFLAISSLSFSNQTKSIGDVTDTNFPKDGEGRVYHLGLKAGEVANRILLVGDPNRAKLLSSVLDDPNEMFLYESNRGFITYTGKKNGVPVTIMSIGMGLPMMDFAIREIRSITEGPLSIIRLGSCGTPREDIDIGSLVVADKSFCITTNYEAYLQNDLAVSALHYFHINSPIQASTLLHQGLVTSLKDVINPISIIEATDATADFFYSTQGRIDDQFDDRNKGLLDAVMEIYPETGSLQMETYHLFYLARLSRSAEKAKGDINVAACSIVLAQRKKSEFLTNERKHELEIIAGTACLEALVQFEN